jgi:hypothetical protein
LDQLKATIREPSVPHGNLILIGGTMPARYQYGDLIIRKRNKGPDVWQFRFFDNGKRKSVLIGTLEKLPTKADAERAVEHRGALKSMWKVRNGSFIRSLLVLW